jgi:hypothetical protein
MTWPLRFVKRANNLLTSANYVQVKLDLFT